MKIRMKVQISGTRNGEDWPTVGEVTDLPTGEAQHLVASGVAEEVGAEEPEVETATVPATPEEKRPAARTKAPAKTDSKG
ncbi:hypothetical protein [Streptomyces prasinus]|uniref:hypothetical protein n=1 Tax=Streptomyces prasinus TaxID=67345 RepID=UPI0036AC8015